MRHIQEGPVQKNKALQDVEFVLHCLLGLTTTDDKDNEYFIPQASAVVIQKNSAGHIMVTCPNNRTYNLSCALKNANLAYFTFTQALHETLLKSPEKYAALIIPLSNPLLHPEDSDRPIFSLEEAAIRFYTSEQYKIMNKLLRGQETDLTNKEWQLYFIVSLLAISGANKNVASQTDEKKFIYRFLHHLPLGFATQILLNREPQHLAGLTSFSEKTTGSDYFVGRRPFKITLANRGRVKDIKPVSQVPDAEEEVLFTTMDVYYEKDTSDENAVTAYLIYGPSTEINDHYLSESALSYAYENYLRHAYTDEAHKSNDGIERPNHALAHHVRAAFYTDSVIDYFSRFGSTDLQYFCQALSHQEKEMIKVMMAFSKTGRQSEISFIENPVAYEAYQEASCHNMRNFLKKNTSLFDAMIQEYVDVLRYMGNPNFSEKVTGTDDEKNRKKYLNHIITLAHKLDLPRCYDETEWNASLKSYHDGPIITVSDESITDFDSLKKLALATIAETGDRSLVDSTFETKSENHFKANSDVFFCFDRCIFTKNTFQLSKENVLAITTSDAVLAYSKNIETYKNPTPEQKAEIIAQLQDENHSLAADVAFIKYLHTSNIFTPAELNINNIIIDYSLKKQKKFSDIVSLMHITNWNDSEKKALLDKIFENIIKTGCDQPKINAFISENCKFFNISAEVFHQKMLDHFLDLLDHSHFSLDDITNIVKFLRPYDLLQPEEKKRIIDGFFKISHNIFIEIDENEPVHLNEIQKELYLKYIIENPSRLVTVDNFLINYHKVTNAKEKKSFFSAWITQRTSKIESEKDFTKLSQLPECDDNEKKYLIQRIFAASSHLIDMDIQTLILLYKSEWLSKSDKTELFLKFVKVEDYDTYSPENIKTLFQAAMTKIPISRINRIILQKLELWKFSFAINFLLELPDDPASNERKKLFFRKAIAYNEQLAKYNEALSRNYPNPDYCTPIMSSASLEKILTIAELDDDTKRCFLTRINYETLSLTTSNDLVCLLKYHPPTQWTEKQQVALFFAAANNMTDLLKDNNGECISTLNNLFQLNKPLSDLLLEDLKNKFFIQRFTLEHEFEMTEHDYHADYIFEKTAKEDVASSSLFSSLLAQNPSLRQVIERMLFYIDQTKNNENTNEYKFLLSLFKSIDNARLLIAQPAPAAEKGIDGPSSENATH